MRKLAEPLAGLVLFETTPYRDHRGAFARCYCDQLLAEVGIDRPVRQGNLSNNACRGTLRGLHLQKSPHAETKIVQCLQGAIFDVAVDVRPGSGSFGHWYGARLDAENGLVMVVPEGFAHGYLTLEDNSLVHYLVTAAYAPEAECGFRFDDPAFAIDWPIMPVVISKRDRSHPLVAMPESA